MRAHDEPQDIPLHHQATEELAAVAYRAMSDEMIVDLAKMTWREGDYPDHGRIEVTVPCYEKVLNEQSWDPADGDYTGVGSRTVEFIGTANGVKAKRIR